MSQFLSGNLAFWDAHTMAGVTYKRIDSLKKELTIHNYFEKELIESILQLSTPDSLPLYILPGLQSKLQDFGFTIDYQPAYIIMVILTRVNVGGVYNFAAVALYGFTILLSSHHTVRKNRILKLPTH